MLATTGGASIALFGDRATSAETSVFITASSG